MRKKKQVKRVAMVLRLSYESGRDLLYGISLYAKRCCHWRFHIINLSGDVSATLAELQCAEAEGLDGIIANGVDKEEIAQFLKRSKIPLVVIGARSPGLGRRIANLAFVRNDDVAIGRYGAAYLASLGRFRSYGFIARTADTFHYAPALREEGFRSYLAGREAEVHTYHTAVGTKSGSYADISAIAESLKALPKPADVMAAHDLRASHALEVAAAAGIKVPKDVAIIGVDNDEVICDTSDPTLTSIAPDHVRLGEIAAEALARLMRSAPCTRTFTIRSTAKTMVERMSAKPVAPASRLVEQAMTFIRRNAIKGIGAMDVVRHLGVSRRLADLRFKQLTGESILGTILNIRLAALQKHLRETDTPIAKLTASCGFRCENYAKKLFKSRFGMSMTDYRKNVKCKM